MGTAPDAPTPAFPDHPDWSRPQRLALIAAVVGLAIYGVAGAANLAQADAAHKDGATQQFFLSWLVGFTYWISLPVGGMALLMIHYLAKTSWGLLLTRPLEAATRTLPLMAALFIPIAISTTLGGASPYWWSELASHGHDAKADAQPKEQKDDKKDAKADPDAEKRQKLNRAFDEQVAKAVAHQREYQEHGTFGFLSVKGFIGCSIAYFVIWGAFVFYLNKWGQDAQSDPAKVDASLEKMKNISGPGLIIYGITITAAATHWVMSLQEGWASTMFPVIFAVNQFLTCFAFCVALFLTLATLPPIRNVLRPKFQIDMGSLMLAFTLFWSYTSFSQMMLIWIGNLPEEIPFFLKRSAGGWWNVSAVLIVFHFGLPFLLLLFRDIKLHPGRLRAVAIYLLVICAVDVWWWIAPSLPHDGQWLWVPMDFGAIVGVGGVWASAFLWQLKKRPLLPVNQLFLLPEGHHHEHH